MQEEHFYDHFHQDQPTDLGRRAATAFVTKILKKSAIEAGQSVLEIGPGRGVLADLCLGKGIEYAAIEPNRQLGDSLKARGVDITCARIPPVPDMGRTFDCVVMINVMEHMSSMPDALQTAEEIRGLLEPHGKLAICSPDYLNYRHNFFNCDFSHNYVTTERRLRQLLISAGFDNIRSHYLSGPFCGATCFIVSGFVSRLPFGLLHSIWPKNKTISKLYKAQLTFSRKVLTIGENPG